MRVVDLNSNQEKQFDDLRSLIEVANFEKNTEKQHRASEAADVAFKAIVANYGPDSFRPYLTDASTPMRLVAALAILNSDPDAAIPVLVDINDNAVGLAASNAYFTLFELRRRGKLPAGVQI